MCLGVIKYSVSSYYYSLTGLRLSVACSNPMDGGFPSRSIGHRAVRLHPYIIFRVTRHLFLLHPQLVCSPLLIHEPYAPLLPPDHDRQVSWPPLPCHFIFKNRLRRNVMGHNVVAVGDVTPNLPHPRVRQCLTNGGVLPFSILAPRLTTRNLLRYPIMTGFIPRCPL